MCVFGQEWGVGGRELLFFWVKSILLSLDFRSGLFHPKQLKPQCLKGCLRIQGYVFSLNYDILERHIYKKVTSTVTH